MKTLGWRYVAILVGVLFLALPLVVLADELEPDFESLISTPIPRANSAAVSPDGQYLYVVQKADPDGTTVPPSFVKLNAHTLEVMQVLTLPNGLGGDVALSPDGTRAYVAMSGVAGSDFFGSGRVVMVDTTTYTITDEVIFSSDDWVSSVAVHPFEEKIYVTSRQTAGKIYVIDTGPTALTRTNTINIGAGPVGVAISPDGKRVYTANRKDATLSVVDTALETLTQTVNLPIDAAGSGTRVVFNPDGKEAYIAFSNYQEGGQWVGQYRFVVVNTDPNSVEFHAAEVVTTTGSYLQDVTLSDDGTYAFLASLNSDEMLIYDTNTHTEVGSVEVSTPKTVATGPDRNTVYVISKETERVIKIKQGRFHVDNQGAVARPSRLTYHPQGETLYLLQGRDSESDSPATVWLLDPVTLEASDVLTLPTGIPSDLTTSPDGAELYVTLSGWAGSQSYGKDRLVIIDTATFSTTHILSFYTDGFTRVVAHPNGEKVYVTARGGGGKLYIFDVVSPTVAPKVLNVGDAPVGLGVTPDGSRVYVANRTSANLSVIETVSDTVTTTVDLPIQSSGSATSVAITPDGEKAYVSYSTYSNGSWVGQYRAVVVDIDPASPTYHATSVITTTGARLNQFDIIAEGAYAVVTSQDTDELIFIDTATDAEVQRVYTGDGPVDVTAWVEPNVAYVANADGSVVRIHLEPIRVFLPIILRPK